MNAIVNQECKCSQPGNGQYDFGKKCCRTSWLRMTWNLNRPQAEHYLARWTKEYGADEVAFRKDAQPSVTQKGA